MGIVDDDSLPRRRDPDDTVLPVVMLKVEERLREDRHMFRNEMAAIAAKQEVAQAQASAEHAILAAAVAKLQHSVEPIPQLVGQVAKLQEHDTIGTTRQQDRDQVRVALRWWAMTLIAAIGTATGLILAFNH